MAAAQLAGAAGPSDPSIILDTMAAAVADCKAQTRALEERKAALLVELATISDSLEDVHKSRAQLESMAEDVLDGVSEQHGEEFAAEAQRKFEAASSAAPPPKMAVAADACAESQPEPPQPHPKKAPKQRVAKAASKQKAHDARKAARLAAALPTDDEAREELKRRQIVLRGLPPGSLDAAGVATLLCAAYGALRVDGYEPAGDEPAGDACHAGGVQLYGGGSYAFVALAHASLAATAPLLSAIRVEGSLLTLTRVWEYEADTRDAPLHVPPQLDLTAVVQAALAVAAAAATSSSGGGRGGGGGGGGAGSLESKLFWSLRNHRCNPRPNDKEVWTSRVPSLSTSRYRPASYCCTHPRHPFLPPLPPTRHVHVHVPHFLPPSLCVPGCTGSRVARFFQKGREASWPPQAAHRLLWIARPPRLPLRRLWAGLGGAGP